MMTHMPGGGIDDVLCRMWHSLYFADDGLIRLSEGAGG